MNRFNLTFSGEILPGEDPEQVKLRFAEMFSIDDPERLERFFSGEAIILRRNLERKAAAECYQELRNVGVAVALVKVTAAQAAEAVLTPATSAAQKVDKAQVEKPRVEKPRVEKPRVEEPRTRGPATKEKTGGKAAGKPATGKRAARRKKKKRKASRRPERRAEEQLLLPLESDEELTQTTTRLAPTPPAGPAKQAKPQPKKPKPAKPKPKPVKSTLELPLRERRDESTPPVRRRQAGEPNFYQVEPFRVTATIKARAEQSRRRSRRDLLIGLASLAACLLSALLLSRSPTVEPVTRIEAAAAQDSGQLAIAAGQWVALHDRAGLQRELIALEALGISSLESFLGFTASGELLVLGSRQAELELLRCALPARSCDSVETPLQAAAISALAGNPIDGSLFILSKRAGRLVHIAADGRVLNTVQLDLPPRPRLVVDAGLLLVNSAEAPAINVYRYDASAFGKQLDQILLLPPPAIDAGQTVVEDFLRTDDGWWVTMANPTTGTWGLYRFDTQWNFSESATLEQATTLPTLTAWGSKLLVDQGQSLALERFSGSGLQETPFLPEGLVEVTEGELAASQWQHDVLRVTLTGCAALGLLFLFSAYHQHARTLVYSAQRERGAPPLDDQTDNTTWVNPAPQRTPRLSQFGLGYGVLTAACVLVGIGQGINAVQLGALLLALAGPLAAWQAVKRAPAGHIGCNDGMLVLCDHRDIYQRGAGAQIARRGNFLILDDVVVYCGGAVLPAFDPQQLHNLTGKVISGGVRVDRKTLWVKLMEGGHPFARGAMVCTLLCGAALILVAGGLAS